MNHSDEKFARKQKQEKVVRAMLEIENIYEYLTLERDHDDQIKVKRMYIDMAGDLVAGIILGQMLYWWTPKKTGELRVSIEHDGKLWIAKGRKDWWEEIRITAKQFDRGCQILESKNLIETAIYKFKGSPTKHVRPNETSILQGVKSILTKGKYPNSPKGEIEVDERGNSILPKGRNLPFIAKTTSKNTEKITTEREQRTLSGEPYTSICTRFHTESNPDHFKHIKIFPDEFAHLKKYYSPDDDEGLWNAFEDLENNIEQEPNNQKLQTNHFATLKKYLDTSLRRKAA